ncbi:MAG: Lrp/AsnC family transcriptional regulator [Burkholderiales bacterium]|jgi:Lrp/AsnC family leucine-responsive transcriptional regulator|nr:Lrp/AsnC family transcriptional regulator [Burkholderiales bacterium]
MKPFDSTDQAILLALQRDARQTMAELAEHVSLSQSPCWRRVRQLEDSGVIEGYQARLSRKHLGYGVTGFIHLQMQNHTAEIAAAFEREVVALPQVVSCHNLSGHYDYLIEAIATDLEAFSALVRNKIRCLPGVKEIATSFSLKEVKAAGSLPVGG